MKRSIYIIFLLLFFIARSKSQINFSDLESQYINNYTSFYPSKALQLGKHKTVYLYEDRSLASIENWIRFNKEVLEKLSETSNVSSLSKKINHRLLTMQIREELRTWQEEQPHLHSPELYTNLMEKALPQIFENDYLTQPDIVELVCSRITAIHQLSTSARHQIVKSTILEIEKSTSSIKSTIEFIQSDLKSRLNNHTSNQSCPKYQEESTLLIEELKKLIHHLETEISIDSLHSNSILGKEKYAQQLIHYTDQKITPDQLSRMALKEIEEVRQLILEVSTKYVKEIYGPQALTSKSEEIIKIAFKDMEQDAPVDGADYLAFWQEIAEAAATFVKENNIATLPEFPTLRIINAPESAGAAARIGWVSSAPPFDPNPVTTLYLPSIPDTFPQKEREDFWASFNKPFNRMIVIHELIPGHYMQIKVSRETPHPLRLWFPYGPYFEGWASFTEEVVLDAGWEKDRPLTYLAHLRKRLENANRAYTSVMVHCNGWTQEQVMDFSIETSLLAPQFAKSLWGRLMRSPMQMTSYFYGGREFRILLANEKERLGKDFDLKYFMDTIIKTGPIVIEDFNLVFRSEG